MSRFLQPIGGTGGANGDVTRWTPAFTATGLTYTGTGVTHPCYNSYYVKNGRIVSFWIQIDLDTVTNFGTGQYKSELPFMPLAGSMNHFAGWCLVDPAANPDLAGHAILNVDHLTDTKTLDFHYLRQAGGAHTPIMEGLFRQDEPAVMTVNSTIYVNGTYITSE